MRFLNRLRCIRPHRGTGRTGETTARPRRFRGQGVVEFALVSLLLMTMVAGVVDLGRGVYARTTLSNAVREGARYGATNPIDRTGMIAAMNATSPGLRITGTTKPDANPDDSVLPFYENGGEIHCSDRRYAWLPPVTTSNKAAAPAGLALGVMAPALAAQAVAADNYDCVSNYSSFR